MSEEGRHKPEDNKENSTILDLLIITNIVFFVFGSVDNIANYFSYRHRLETIQSVEKFNQEVYNSLQVLEKVARSNNLNFEIFIHQDKVVTIVTDSENRNSRVTPIFNVEKRDSLKLYVNYFEERGVNIKFLQPEARNQIVLEFKLK